MPLHWSLGFFLPKKPSDVQTGLLSGDAGPGNKNVSTKTSQKPIIPSMDGVCGILIYPHLVGFDEGKYPPKTNISSTTYNRHF